jgi:aminobenzoyl-glutamate utilization protein B
MDNRSEIWRGVDEVKPRFIELSDRVWAMPEVCYTEARSSAEHLAELRHQSFRITENVAGIAEPRPIEAGGHGHGCGHNLLGSAALLAATAVKDWLAANKVPGRVRYYGCPAEEGGAAKAFMVRSGAFADADIAITWHPSSFWEVVVTPSLANTRADFSFTGRTSHAAASPHLGRSALDAVELMNVGVNYMREHMPSDARVHYALLDTGGIAPNVVQAHARVRYSIRARDLPGMNELVARVHKIAQGAALMTETKVEMKIISAVSNVMANTPLEQALHRIMEDLGPPNFDEADAQFAAKIRSTLTDKDIASVYYTIGMDPTDRPLADFIVPLDAKRNPLVGSTDVGDVSWVVPTVQVHSPTVAIGTPFHTWQVVAQGKTPAAHKAMVQAAKAMAGLGVKALNEPDLIEAAKADLKKRTARTPYVSPLPDNVAPPLDMSVN